MTRVGIADDQALVRAGLETIIRHSEGLELISVRRAMAWRPSSSLGIIAPMFFSMDIRMPMVDGIEATTRIVADPDLILDASRA